MMIEFNKLIFQTDMNRSDTLRNQTLFEHVEMKDQGNLISTNRFENDTIILLKIIL